VPKEELESFERILFLLEQAHWFYEDNSVEHNPNLKSLSFKDFTSLSKFASSRTPSEVVIVFTADATVLAFCGGLDWWCV
jgi:hypothetical protein